MEFISNTNNLILLALMLVSGTLLLGPNFMGFIQGQSGVTPAIATQLINRNKANVIDIRDSESYVAGHISRAKHIESAKLIETLSGMKLDKSAPVILVCDSGMKSSSFVSKVKDLGFKDVVCLDGGIKAWNLAGLPLIK
jgi:rhodanese-related sulfurtransferase